jgi:hypothetical protein
VTRRWRAFASGGLVALTNDVGGAILSTMVALAWLGRAAVADSPESALEAHGAGRVGEERECGR